MKVISFYSYKGGAGRTVCAANIAPLLAKDLGATAESPILVMDMDLDSAGLTHLFNQYDRFKESQWTTSKLLNRDVDVRQKEYKKIFFTKDERVALPDALIDKLLQMGAPANLLKDLQLRASVIRELEKETDYERLAKELKRVATKIAAAEVIENSLPAAGMVDISEEIGADKGTIYFVGAEQVGKDTILEGMADTPLGDIIGECKRKKFCAILIDSASGRQPSANLVHRFSDIIMYCVRLTKQFREGTNLQLQYFINTNKIRTNVDIILLPVAVPQSSYSDNVYIEEMKKDAVTHLDIFSRNCRSLAKKKSKNVKVIRDFIDNGIPEVESFKWVERVLAPVQNDLGRYGTGAHQAFEVFEALSKKIKELVEEELTR